MTAPSQGPGLPEVLAQLNAAHDEVARICSERWHRTGDWRTSIPVREDYDSDIIIGRALQAAVESIQALREENETLKALLNTPETEDFDKAVPLEAAHQVVRWGAAHDSGKNPEDWFWVVGYLAGKALAAFKTGDLTKARHHCISTAAALRNWHAHIRSGSSVMRPGIEPPPGEST